MSKTLSIALWAVAGAALVGCGDEINAGGPAGAPTTPAAPVAPAPAAPEEPVEEEEGSGEELVFFPDETFVELDERNRDPFRNFASLFVVTAADDDRPRRNVILSEVGIEEMRLIAVVTGSSFPRAMLQGPDGVGYIVRRGDFVGEEELVETGGSESLPVRLNWRVGRIRESSVVLTREDPTSPNQAPLTRAIPLYEEGEEYVGNVVSVDPNAFQLPETAQDTNSSPGGQTIEVGGRQVRIEGAIPIPLGSPTGMGTTPAAPAGPGGQMPPPPSAGRMP